MPRKFHAPYPAEYRERVLELVRAGRTPEDLGREFEVSAACVRNWIKQAGLDAGERSDGLTTSEKDELSRLRREIQVLREEKEILKKAAAWFAQDTLRTPPKRSGS